MRKTQIRRLVESRNMTMDEVSVLSSKSRTLIGLPAIIPETDYSPVQRFVDSILPGYGGLRKLFGLDQEVVSDPVYTINDDGGKASQAYQRNVTFSNQRAPIYNMVEEMDGYDLTASALDLYAEEATQQDPETQRVVWVESPDAEVRSTLMDMLTRLGMDDRAYHIVRTMCKYGDAMEQVVTSEGLGIKHLMYVHPARITRVEDKMGQLQGFCAGILSVEDSTWENIKEEQGVSYPWDFIHFRIMSNNRDSRHGDSILLGARRAYQQLKMIEDMLVLYRISRGMDRDVYYVGTGGSTQTQGWNITNTFRQEVRKKLGINPTSGSMRQEYNVITPDNDLFIPVTGRDDPTRVERQTGGAPQGEIPDVDHFRRKMLGALRIPSAFIGFENDTPAKATLASQYPRFARAIKRIQRGFKQGVRWMCEIHLIRKGILTRDEAGRMVVKFTVKMASIDQLEELAKMEIYNARVDLVTKMLSLIAMQQQPDPQSGLIIPQSGLIKNIDAWVAWVLRNFMGCNDAEVEMFLGDANLGLTQDIVDIRALTETAENNGLLGNFKSNVKHFVETIRICREGDDYTIDSVNLDVSDRLEEDETAETIGDDVAEGKDAKGGIYEDSNFDLQEEETKLSANLHHEGDGPIIMCPKCKKNSLVVKRCKVSPMDRNFDKLEGESVYTICKCGYLGLTEDKRTI